jgi:hypothetical protein
MQNTESTDERVIAFLTMIGMYLVRVYTLLSYQISTNAKQLYNSSDVVRVYTDTFNDQMFTFTSLISSHCLEAPYSHWTVCYKNGEYGETRVNADAIFYNLSDIPTIENISNSYKNVSKLISPSILKNEVDSLILTHVRNRFVDSFVSRIIDNKSTDNDEVNDICSLDKTRNFFLNINYSHPDMIESITIDLDKRFLIKGNELFSPCFILRLLNYQSKPFEFDNKYVLKLLDSSINNIELKYNQYIQLGSEDYKVCNLTTPQDKKLK